MQPHHGIGWQCMQMTWWWGGMGLGLASVGVQTLHLGGGCKGDIVDGCVWGCSPIGLWAFPEVASVQLFVAAAQLCKKAGHVLQPPLNTLCHQHTCSGDTVAQ